MLDINIEQVISLILGIILPVLATYLAKYKKEIKFVDEITTKIADAIEDKSLEHKTIQRTLRKVGKGTFTHSIDTPSFSKGETQQEELHRLEFDTLENLKNRIGFSTNTPISRVIEELERLAKKSTKTINALNITKKDYELLGLDVPGSLS